MIFSYKINSKRINIKLQSRLDFCNLQSTSRQILSINNNLHKFLDCRMQTANEVCDLGENRYKSITYVVNVERTANTSPYGRGASFRVGPVSLLNIFEPANCTTRGIFVVLPPNFFPSRPINPSQQKPNLSPDPQGNFFPSCLADDTCTPNGKLSPRCLCLDLGTTAGWALVNPEKILSSGSHNFRPSRFQGGGIRYLKFINFLDQLLTTTQQQLSLVFFEEVRRHLGVDAAHAYGGFVAQLTAWCEQHNIAYEGVPVGTIKRHATGRGNAAKAQVIESVKQRGHQPVDDNEADALALAYWAIDNRLGG